MVWVERNKGEIGNHLWSNEKMMWCALLSLIFTYKKFHKAKIKNFNQKIQVF